MKERDIEITKLQTSSHQNTIAKESQEASELHSAISAITNQRDTRLAHRDEIRAQISTLQAQIKARKEAQQKHSAYLSAQSRHNVPELDFWQDYLCLRIEGVGQDDRLKFVFTHVCEADWDREAWFELGTGSRDYQVFSYRPKVEREEIDGVLERLNETRDLAPFLKGMRELFVQALK